MEEQSKVWDCEKCRNKNPWQSFECLNCQNKRSSKTQAQCNLDPIRIYRDEKLKDLQNIQFDENEGRRILMVGIPGSGKSSLGNNLLERHHFKASCSPNPVTDTAICGIGKWKKKEIVVFDTPGIDRLTGDTDSTRLQILLDIFSKCFWSLSPGFHAIAFVINIGRLSDDTLSLLENLKRVFGDSYRKFLFVVFTRIDDLDEGQTLESLIDEADERVKSLAKTCGYVGINNKATGRKNEQQLAEFFQKVDDKRAQNDGNSFTNKHFQEIYEILKEEAENKKESISKMRLKEPPSKIRKIINRMLKQREGRRRCSIL